MTHDQDVIPEMLGMGGGGFRGGRGGGPRGGGPGYGGGGGGAAQLQSLDMRQIQKLNGILRMAKFTLIHRRVHLVSANGDMPNRIAKPQGSSLCSESLLKLPQTQSSFSTRGTARRAEWLRFPSIISKPIISR